MHIDYSNSHGNNAIAKIMMITVAVLNAGRNSFSFFLLLIVCLGYGVVKHTLGKTMTYVRFLAVVHFVFGVIYAVASLTIITPDNAGPLVLLVILPLAGTLTAFYVWTLNALNFTMKDLLERKQHVKAMMYKKLWFCIIGSILVIFAFFFFNSFTFAGRSDPNFVPHHWKTRWFIIDGWLNLVYLFDISYVAYLWRPTANNRRFAMSDEVSLAVTDSDKPAVANRPCKAGPRRWRLWNSFFRRISRRGRGWVPGKWSCSRQRTPITCAPEASQWKSQTPPESRRWNYLCGRGRRR